MDILIGVVAGALGLAVWQIYRGMAAGKSFKEAAGNVISGGGGPGSGETPK